MDLIGAFLTLSIDLLLLAVWVGLFSVLPGYLTYTYHQAKGTSKGLKILWTVLSANLYGLIWWTARLIIFRLVLGWKQHKTNREAEISFHLANLGDN